MRQDLQDKLDPLLCVCLMSAAMCAAFRPSRWASVKLVSTSSYGRVKAINSRPFYLQIAHF
jgi:hypothetical protein